MQLCGFGMESLDEALGRPEILGITGEGKPELLSGWVEKRERIRTATSEAERRINTGVGSEIATQSRVELAVIDSAAQFQSHLYANQGCSRCLPTELELSISCFDVSLDPPSSWKQCNPNRMDGIVEIRKSDVLKRRTLILDGSRLDIVS